MSCVHIAPKCDSALPWVRSNTPATHEVDWMHGSRHNKNANRQTDTHRFLPLLERRICSAPPSEASNIQCWLLLPKLRSSKNGIRTSPSDLDMFLWDSLWNLTVQVCNFCTASKTKLNYRTAAVAKPVQPIAQPKNCWCPDISMLLNG